MIEYLALAAGLALLIKGADFLVEGASSLAKKLGVPSLIIGLTIVAFGTSMPELVVNVIAALNGTADIAFGNIIGSNLANILLILGICALIFPLAVKRSTVWKEIPFSFLAVVALIVFTSISFWDDLQVNALLRTEGIILILFFIIFLYYVFGMIKQNKPETENGNDKIKDRSGIVIFLMIAAGLAGLYFGGVWTVDGAVTIARGLGLSEFLISATIIAVGTSLPELITSVVAVRKRNVDLAVGNVVGSNIFNIFWILGLTAIIRPLPLPDMVNLDLIILLGTTFLLFLFMFIGKRHTLQRWQGGVFVALYVGYLVLIITRG